MTPATAALAAAVLVAGAVLLVPGRPRPSRRGPPSGGVRADRPPLLDAPLVLDLVAAVVEAGAPPLAAVGSVARVLREAGSPVTDDLLALVPGHLDPAAGRAVAALQGPLARCLQLAEQTGAPVAVLLRSSADELRRRRRRASALAAARLGVRVVAPLGLCTLPAFAALAVVPVLLSLGRDLLAG